MVMLDRSTPRTPLVLEAAERRQRGDKYVSIADRLSIKLILVVSVCNNLMTIQLGRPEQLGGLFGHCY
jgi:hypothetical protein